jgi:DNA transposition AAA+ family ATPase
VVGESRTGKTMACDAYRLRNKPQQIAGKPPTVPVIYLQVPQECGAKELFGVILGHLKYQVTKGTVAEMRDRTLRVMKGCQVEMLIIDEADRFKPKTFAEVRQYGSVKNCHRLKSGLMMQSPPTRTNILD